MALSLSWNHNLIRTTTVTPCTVVHRQHQNQPGFSVSVRAQVEGERCNVNRVWRRRKLKRKDDRLQWRGWTPTLFLEERLNKIKDCNLHINHDINKMLLSEENRFDFVNEIIVEANELLDKDPDAYGSKKPVYHALTNRLNAKGIHRPEAYIEPNPYNIKRHGIIHQPFFLC